MKNSDFKILVGDEDLKTLHRIKQILKEEEFSVWTSNDPGEILRIIESGNFDLLILDIKIYAQIASQDLTVVKSGECAVPLIILTTDDDFALTIDAIKEGAADFLDKPVKVKRLLITIRNALLHYSKLKQLRHDQEELAYVKELYERIINGIDYGIIVLDQNLRIESINQHLRQKHKKNTKTIIGKYCYQFFYHRSTICNACRVREVFVEGKPVKYNLVNKAVGGLNYHLEVEAFPLRDARGNITRVVQLIKDVTERVHLERELRLKKEYLENLVSHTPVGIITTDREGFIRTANPAFAKLVSVKSPQDAIGLNVLQSEESKAVGLDQEFRKVLTDGTPIEIEAIHPPPQLGIKLIFSLTAVPLRGVEGEITGLIATLTDATQKWQLEESYRKRITELSIFKDIGDLLQSTIELSDIYAIALIGVTAGRGLGFNRAFLLRYNRNKNMLIGEMAIGPSDAQDAKRIWTDLYEKDLSLKDIFETYRQNRDEKDVKVKRIVEGLRIPITWETGFLHDVLFKNMPWKVDDALNSKIADQKLIATTIGCNSFAAVPLMSRGKAEGVIIADNIITGKEITDEDINRLSIIANQAGAAIENSQLLQNLEEKVEALRQAYLDLKENRDLLLRAERLSVVGEVAASVAHEIRNPLTSIGGFTRAVLRDLENTEKVRTNRRFLSIILEEVKRLERIVNEILEFVHPVSPRFAYTDLNEVVEQTFNMMAGEIDENRYIITKDYQEGLPPVWMDADQIRQVLMNLLRNAIHAMDDGGMLSVITTGTNENVKIHISDTGVGIPEENKDKLFTAFFTTKSTGSGLGLTVSSQLIKNHGGTIEVESQEGEGSTFIITLPLRRREERHEKENSDSGRREESTHPL